jgi:hypothetical protein
MAGYIYDHRQELESNVWLMPPLYHRVWQWLKYSVNHSETRIPNRDGSFTTIFSGQRATSYRQIAKGVGYYEGKIWKEPNTKTIKSILDWLNKNKMISVWGNTEGTTITIANWELYQSNLIRGNTKRTTKGTPREHQVDTNNKGITNEELMIINNGEKITHNCTPKLKKEFELEFDKSKRFTPPSLEDVRSYCLERKNNVNYQKFIDFYTSKGWYVGKNKMKDWKASIRNWEGTNKTEPQKQNEMANKYSNEELMAKMMKKRG